MNSRKAWGGNVDPFILTKFVQNSDANGGNSLVSLVIFEWDDEALIGRSVSDDPEVFFLPPYKVQRFSYFH